MNDKQRATLLRSALADFRKTTEGYLNNPTGPNWRAGMAKADRLLHDLAAAVPALGPVFALGKSVLLHDLTHKTSGIPLYPAFDDAFRQGTVIIAPEPLTVIEPFTSSNPGEAFYARGQSKLGWWFGHLDRNHPIGTRFAKGDAVGRVAVNTIGGGPHVHVGINVELLLGAGKQLAHHTNYTHGAPLIGVQLAKALEA